MSHTDRAEIHVKPHIAISIAHFPDTFHLRNRDTENYRYGLNYYSSIVKRPNLLSLFAQGTRVVKSSLSVDNIRWWDKPVSNDFRGQATRCSHLYLLRKEYFHAASSHVLLVDHIHMADIGIAGTSINIWTHCFKGGMTTFVDIPYSMFLRPIIFRIKECLHGPVSPENKIQSLMIWRPKQSHKLGER